MNLQPESGNLLSMVKSELLELRAEFEPGAAVTIFTIRGATIAYDAQQQELNVNGFRVPAPLRGNRQRLTVYCDRTTLEVFASDGLVGVPVAFRPKADGFSLEVSAYDGLASVPIAFVPKADDFSLRIVPRGMVGFHSLEVHELKSAWNGQ